MQSEERKVVKTKVKELAARNKDNTKASASSEDAAPANNIHSAITVKILLDTNAARTRLGLHVPGSHLILGQYHVLCTRIDGGTTEFHHRG